MDILPVVLCVLSAIFAAAQTLTTTDAAGNSVVVVATTDAAGAPLTQTIQTLTPGGQPAPAPATTTTTTPTTPTTTTTTQAPAAPPAQGPVAAPGPTPNAAGAVTPFTYVTLINGVPTTVTDNFTPTNPASAPFAATGTGTVWNFSQYMSIYGGPQATGAAYQNKASSGFAVITCLLTILMQLV